MAGEDLPREISHITYIEWGNDEEAFYARLMKALAGKMAEYIHLLTINVAFRSFIRADKYVINTYPNFNDEQTFYSLLMKTLVGKMAEY